MPNIPHFFLVLLDDSFSMENPLVFVIVVIILVFLIIPLGKLMIDAFRGRLWRW